MLLHNTFKSVVSKTRKAKIDPLSLLLLLISLAVPASQARADVISYDVTFGSLGSLNGRSDLNLDFVLIPSGAANGSTTLNFSNFNYGGGSGPATQGPLTDTDTFNEVFSPFTAGSSLSFRIDANFTREAANPDIFSFGLFTGVNNFTQTDTNPTVGAAQGDGISYFTLAFDGANPSFNTYAGTNPAFAAPTVRVTTAPVPEPSSYAMMALGIGALGLMSWKRKRSQSQPTTDLVNVAI